MFSPPSFYDKGFSFSYIAGYPNKPWIIDISVENVGGSFHASIYVNEQPFVNIVFLLNEWELVIGQSLPDGYTIGDIGAIGEMIREFLILNEREVINKTTWRYEVRYITLGPPPSGVPLPEVYTRL